VLGAFANAFKTPDLRRKILFVLFIVVIFRIGSVVPAPGVNVQSLHTCIKISQGGANANLYNLINLFSGGALLQLAIFALGIMPYITASIILQLLTVVIPRLETLKKEGQSGQTKITQYTRYLTLVLAVLNSTAFVTLAVNDQLFTGCPGIVYDTSIFPVIVMILTMTAGTSVIMWLGELITERGIGNGMSIMIFTQVVATFPAALWGVQKAKGPWIFAMVCLIGLVVIAAVVFIEQAQRRIPVQYARRMVGRKMFGGSSTYIPLKVNQAGVVPIIFASSVLLLPVLLSNLVGSGNVEGSDWRGKVTRFINDNVVNSRSLFYVTVFAVLVVAFAYFYNAIAFDPIKQADQIRKQGGFIPGIRPGPQTERYLAKTVNRITLPGALFIAFIAIIPYLIVWFGNVRNFPFAGTTVLIAVGVALELMRQIDSQLMLRNYEGFLK